MKISKSKQELARIISENGGWRDGFSFAAQDKDGDVFAYDTKPSIGVGREVWTAAGSAEGLRSCTTIRGWNQTILSRDEYSHLYPGSDTALEPVVEAKPTIEQLASDYRNAKDCAERKQQEADAAKSDADAKLKALDLACEAIGLKVSPITAKQEPELAIKDWRDLRVGDIVWVDAYDHNDQGGWPVSQMEDASYASDYAFSVKYGESCDRWVNVRRPWRFIRRP
jgi:hypothetical protein